MSCCYIPAFSPTGLTLLHMQNNIEVVTRNLSVNLTKYANMSSLHVMWTLCVNTFISKMSNKDKNKCTVCYPTWLLGQLDA